MRHKAPLPVHDAGTLGIVTGIRPLFYHVLCKIIHICNNSFYGNVSAKCCPVCSGRILRGRISEKIITPCCKNTDVIQLFVQVAENISLFVASNYHYTILLKKIQEKNFKRA